MVPPNPSPLAPQGSITVPATAESARAIPAGQRRPGFLEAQPETEWGVWGVLRDGSREKGSESHRKQGREPSENVVSSIRPQPESTGTLEPRLHAPLQGRGRQFLLLNQSSGHGTLSRVRQLPSGEGHSPEKGTAMSSRQPALTAAAERGAGQVKAFQVGPWQCLHHCRPKEGKGEFTSTHFDSFQNIEHLSWHGP